MLNNKDYDELAKEADHGFNGLGKIVKAIAILDKKTTQQQGKVIKLTWPTIIMTGIILIMTGALLVLAILG
jgi:hypothetical protein